MIKQAITLFLLPIFVVMSMEIDEHNNSLQQPIKATSQKIEIITDINKQNSYSVAVSLCIKKSNCNEFATKMQKIYDTHNLKLTYVDEGKFWQIPHVTLAIFKGVKLEDIESFQGLFEQLDATSLQFTPSTYAYFGKGDWLTVKPHPSIGAKIKELNARVIDWAQTYVKPETYKIQNNTTKNKLIPHMALNTTVATIDGDYKHHITKTLREALKSTPIALEDVIITATNEWS